MWKFLRWSSNSKFCTKQHFQQISTSHRKQICDYIKIDVEKSEIGLYDEPNLFLFDFGMGMILSSFHMCGRTVVCIGMWNSRAKFFRLQISDTLLVVLIEFLISLCLMALCISYLYIVYIIICPYVVVIFLLKGMVLFCVWVVLLLPSPFMVMVHHSVMCWIQFVMPVSNVV